VASNRKLGVEFAVMFLLLLAVLSLFLPGVYLPDQTLFSNDGPLGRLMAQCHQMPGRFTGCWEDLNGIGFNGGTAPPGITSGLQLLLKPVWFSKLYALVSLIILGLGAWCLFVNLRLAPAACYLGGLAAALNSNFFSVACWGVAAQAINAGMFFFALAALMDTSSPRRWLRVILAGLAVGMGVIEAADMGAISSLYVGAFIAFQAWASGGAWLKGIALGLSRLTLVAVCAALVAAPAVFSLVATNIKGIVGTQQDTQTKQARWDWATQWSLPVRETTGLVVPGLFGYRMDTPDGGQYWGGIGRTPAIDRFIAKGEEGLSPRGLIRQSGGGFYSGVMVVLLALWSLAQLLYRRDSVFTLSQRRWLWFWLVAAIISALLAFGRYAPFYRIVYALPYFSTIRNPVKFFNFVCFAIIILFAHGVDGLWRKYMQPSETAMAPRWAGFKSWWAGAGKREKSWIYGCGLILAVSLLAWTNYASQRQALLDYLQTVRFDELKAEQIASFSIRQVGWFVFFFVLSAGLIACIFSGAFAGSRARWGGIVLGLLMVADLGRADQPWVVYWNYPQKYASNPIIDRLKDKPFEHRVALLPDQTQQHFISLNNLYRLEWLQQQFPYYNIQSLDIVQMSRMPEDFAAYVQAQASGWNGVGFQSFIRFLQLSNSRFLLGPADELDNLNQGIDQADQQFRIVERFDIVPKPGITNLTLPEQLTAAPDENGAYALFDFSGALPRAKLYSGWQVDTNDQDVLDQLFSPSFNPNQSMLVSDEIPPAATTAGINQNAGSVDFASYSPKDIVLKSDAHSPTVLLLNDHFDPNWNVLVDGRRKPLLRCNFIMRGVYLTTGAHTVEFRFQPFFGLLYVGLSAIGVGVLILIGTIISSFAFPFEPARQDNL
jgi:hypothetical protein